MSITIRVGCDVRSGLLHCNNYIEIPLGADVGAILTAEGWRSVSNQYEVCPRHKGQKQI